MGNCVRKCLKCGVQNDSIPILLIGLENSGKTKIGTVLCKEQPVFDDYAPTQGSRFFEMGAYKKHFVKITELGGSSDMRKIWKYYYLETFGIIYVLDASADAETMSESKAVFSQLMVNEYIAGKPMLVLANKSDIYGAADSIDICEYFAIEHFANLYRTPIMLQETGNHLADDGLENGFSWLIQTIENNLKSLKNRIAFHRKFADDELPRRTLTGSKRKKKVLNEMNNRPNTAPNRFGNVTKEIKTITANSHSTFKTETQVRANEEILREKVIIPLPDPKPVFKNPDPLAKLVQPSYEEMSVEDLSLNYTNESVIRTIADIHSNANIDTIKTL